MKFKSLLRQIALTLLLVFITAPSAHPDTKTFNIRVHIPAQISSTESNIPDGDWTISREQVFRDQNGWFELRTITLK